MDLITASRLRVARACARLHHYEYGLGVRPAKDADTLRFGTLLHHGLEAWWRATPAERLDVALAAMSGESDPFDRARAEALILGYDLRWGGQDLEVLGVEVQFRAPLTNPATGQPSRTWELGGKIDAIVRDPEGRVLVVEHKTSSEDITPGSDYWKRLRLDSQVSVYFDGAKALGHDVAGCLYDVIGKPGQKPYKATPEEDRSYTQPKSRACAECKKKKTAPAPHVETLEDGRQVSCEDGRIVTDPGGRLYANQRAEDETPEEFKVRLLEAIAADPAAFYARGPVVRLASELDEARADAWDQARRIREDEIANRYPRNPDACVRYGRTCSFFDVCTGAASIEDPALFKKLPQVHAELSL